MVPECPLGHTGSSLLYMFMFEDTECGKGIHLGNFDVACIQVHYDLDCILTCGVCLGI